MKKRYKLTDLDCANCAAKMENAIKKIDGVNDATVSFMAQKMTIAARTMRSSILRCLRVRFFIGNASLNISVSPVAFVRQVCYTGGSQMAGLKPPPFASG